MSAIGAQGKIILFGEHAAVYGRPALAAGIPGGIRLVSVEPTPGRMRIRVEPWALDATDQSDNQVGEVLRRLRGMDIPFGCDVVLLATIPPAAGLGSSAALAVALVRAICLAGRVEASDEHVRRMAHELETVFHGQPSGLDDTVAAHGGVCLFRRDGFSDETFGGSPFARITAQALRVPCDGLSILVGNSGVERSTHEMVAKVRRKKSADNAEVEELFDKIEDCLADGLSALVRGDTRALGKSMLANHWLLDRLGVSCPELTDMVELAMSAGASGAKLTGAGGGGGVIAEAEGCEEEVLAAWQLYGYSGWKVALA